MLKTILVIDDQASIRSLFSQSLAEKGFQVIEAEDGRVGIQQAQQHQPDVILCDIIMPDPDGYTVLSRLRQTPETAVIPFIFVTSKVTRTDLRKGMELGADDYLTKPCTTEELVKAIDTQLEKYSILKRWYTSPPLPTSVPKLPTRCVKESIFPANSQLGEIFRFIEANYHHPIALSDVAQTVGYSPAYLTTMIQRRTGRTVQQWIIERRMAAARALLLETDEGIESIASQVGYQHVVHFFRQFRKIHGTTPQNWRSQHRNLNVPALKIGPR